MKTYSKKEDKRFSWTQIYGSDVKGNIISVWNEKNLNVYVNIQIVNNGVTTFEFSNLSLNWKRWLELVYHTSIAPRYGISASMSVYRRQGESQETSIIIIC